MKKLLGMIVLVFWGSSALMSQQYHYYYRGAQVPLELNTDYAYLLLDGISSQAALQSMIGDAKVNAFAEYDPAKFLTRMGKLSTAKRYWAEIQFSGNLTQEAYLKRLEALEQQRGVAYAGIYFSKDSDRKIGLSDLFLVKLKDLGDEETLQSMAANSGVEIIGRDRFLPKWFVLAVGPTAKGNALDLANKFFESGMFAACEPDLMVDEANCVNDTHFGNQWGLENTGIWGGAIDPDINACDGWDNWTTGDPGTVVAVLDHGFEMNHPDLVANVFGTGFDSESGTTPAQVLGSHGTACAGIVAAEQENSLGVSGVAPDCSIMSVSNSLAGSPASRIARADGIIWAYTNGADVISNSWSSSVAYTVIDDAIDDALTLGRGGLGTVIVFATGNNNGAVSYPANSNDEIIAVGAMSPCGERKNPASCDGENWWGSNF
ncbi:MAG TPA: S8 family serine peptidase, partial [Bacteroidia bacterium]|nr:S8 family serine peptidase [Bacteroidia bacterium]